MLHSIIELDLNNAALKTNGVNTDSSGDKLNQDLGLRFRQLRRLYQKLYQRKITTGWTAKVN